MIVDNCEQGSPEWHKNRTGIPTSSEFSRIITGTGNLSSSLDDYALELALQRITGEPGSFFENHWMRRGKELEPKAREEYAWQTGNDVHEVGMCYPDEKKLFSCSPDGLVGEDGGCEIKCLKPQEHARILIVEKMPSTYKQQIQGSMLVTGRAWWDFISYCPGTKLYVQRIPRDEDYIGKMRIAIDKTLQRITFFEELIRE